MRQLRSVILGLVVSGIAHPVMAQQDPQEEQTGAHSFMAAAERAAGEAARQQSRRRGHHGMPKAFRWTGVGLLGYGSFLVFLGASYGPDHLDCPGGNCGDCAAGCPKTRDTLFKGAAPILASGAAVLAVGAVIGANRSPALTPRITLNQQEFALRQAVPVRRWWRH